MTWRYKNLVWANVAPNVLINHDIVWHAMYDVEITVILRHLQCILAMIVNMIWAEGRPFNCQPNAGYSFASYRNSVCKVWRYESRNLWKSLSICPMNACQLPRNCVWTYPIEISEAVTAPCWLLRPLRSINQFVPAAALHQCQTWPRFVEHL